MQKETFRARNKRTLNTVHFDANLPHATGDGENLTHFKVPVLQACIRRACMLVVNGLTRPGDVRTFRRGRRSPG